MRSKVGSSEKGVCRFLLTAQKKRNNSTTATKKKKRKKKTHAHTHTHTSTHTHTQTNTQTQTHTLFFWLTNNLKHSINYNKTKLFKQQNAKFFIPSP